MRIAWLTAAFNEASQEKGDSVISTTRISFSVQIGNEFLFLPTTTMMVPTGLAERFGYVPEGTTGDQPLVLDAVVEAHRLKFGDAFSRQTCTEYLEIRSGQWLTKAFGRPAFYSGFAINGKYAYDKESDYRRSGFTGYSFTEARLSEGDALEIYAFEDSNGMDYYLYFLDDGQRIDELSIAAGQPKELALEGLMFAYGGPMTDEDRRRHRLVSSVKGAELVYVDVQSGETRPFEGAVTDRDGRVSISFADSGTYYISSRGGRCRYNTMLANPWLVVHVS